MLISKPHFINPKQFLLSPHQILFIFISILALLFIPVSGLADSTPPTSKTATLGSVLAQADHFRIRDNGPEQLQQALALYQQAADEGSAVAQYWLGKMYSEGKGTKSNQEQAEHWMQLSAKQAYPPAKEFLAELTQEEGDDDEPDC